jgi:hypothetical protein
MQHTQSSMFSVEAGGCFSRELRHTPCRSESSWRFRERLFRRVQTGIFGVDFIAAFSLVEGAFPIRHLLTTVAVTSARQFGWKLTLLFQTSITIDGVPNT